MVTLSTRDPATTLKIELLRRHHSSLIAAKILWRGLMFGVGRGDRTGDAIGKEKFGERGWGRGRLIDASAHRMIRGSVIASMDLARKFQKS